MEVFKMNEFKKNYWYGKAAMAAAELGGIYTIAKVVSTEYEALAVVGAAAIVASKLGDGLFNELKKAYDMIAPSSKIEQLVLEEKSQKHAVR